MSKYNITYNLGKFGLDLHTDNQKFVDDFNGFLHIDENNSSENNLSLRVVNDPAEVSKIHDLCVNPEANFVSGYMKTPLRHYETETHIYNYDAKRHVALVKDKSTGEISVVLDENNSSNFSSIPMYIAREMTIRAYENTQHHILHSACVAVGDKAYAIVGGPGAGKTSLLLGLLKGGQGAVDYVSNDINFITPDSRTIYPFQIPMLLSSATADSYFADDMSAIKDAPTISYFHEKDQAMIKKYKLNREIVESLFDVSSINGANLSGIIIPNFSKTQKGFNIQILDKSFAKDLIASQILAEDDRFSVDYLGLKDGKHLRIEEALDALIENTPITMITYGKDVFENENVADLVKVFDFLKASEHSPYELHAHTSSSDGQLSAEELVNSARSQNIQTLAITDHNTMNGVLEAQEYITKNNIKDIELISGIELDACDQSCLHILGYNIQDIQQMQQFLKHYDDANKKVYQQIIANLQGIGVNISEEQVLTHFGATELTKQRIGNYLIANGYAKNSSEVTQKYLGKQCPTYVPRVQPTAEECIDIIHKCGGFSVLAHPMELMKYNKQLPTESSVVKYIDHLTTLGLDGIECCTYKHTPEQEMTLIDYCDHKGLIKTIGNDYHGKENQRLGIDEHAMIEDFKQALYSHKAQEPTL